MNRVQVQPIDLPADAAKMVKSWWPIYADDPHWVPPLVFERKKFFHPDKNPYFQVAKVQAFMAFRDGQPVGSIVATVDQTAQEHDPGVGFFGFFEFVDDECIARCLFLAAAGWLREQGMTEARGPYNLSPNHEFGLLVDGFDTDPCLLNPHNRDYYQRHYEAIGLTKAMDWYAYWMDKGPVPERIAKIAQRFLDRNPNVTLRAMDMSRWDEEVRWFYDIYNDAWEQNWGHVKVTEEEFFAMAADMKQLIDPALCWWAFVDGEPAGASITFPDLNQVVKRMNGGLLPFGWFHWVFGRQRVDALRVFVLGVKQEYQALPLGAPLYLKTWEEGIKRDIRGAEASLILETNHRMRGALEKLGARIYKTYRTYSYDLTATEDRA